MKKGGNLLIGIIIGAIAGLIIGYMVSPPKKESNIKNIFGKKTDSLKENLQNFKKKIGEKMNEIKSNFETKWIKNKDNNNHNVDQVEDELGT